MLFDSFKFPLLFCVVVFCVLITQSTAQQDCLSIPNYRNSSVPLNCPPGRVLPRLSNLALYYTGEKFLVPSATSNCVNSNLIGKIGGVCHNGNSSSKVTLGYDFLPLVGESITVSMFVSVPLQYLPAPGDSQKLVKFKLEGGINDHLTVELTRNGDIILIQAIYQAMNHSVVFSAPYAQVQDQYFRSRWNSIVLVRSAAAPLGVRIYVNGESRDVSFTPDIGNIMTKSNILDLALEINDKFALVDELAVWNSAFSETEGKSLSTLYTQSSDICSWSDQQEFGAPSPSYSAHYANEKIVIDVTLSKHLFSSVMHSIDTSMNSSALNQCQNQNLLTPSAGEPWIVYSQSSCSVTYRLEQSMADIYNPEAVNNNWRIQVDASGKSVTHKLSISIAYSIFNGVEQCYQVGYTATVQFNSYLSAFSSLDFNTIDKEASFAVTSIRVNQNNEFEVSGLLKRTSNGATFEQIKLTRKGQFVSQDVDYSSSPSSCSFENSNECAVSFTRKWVELNYGSTLLSGNHSLTFNSKVGNDQSRSLKIDFRLSYTVPQDPTIINGDTLVSTLTLKSDSTFLTPRMSAYKSSDTVYMVNEISHNLNLPSGYQFNFESGYFCCVNTPYSLPSYTNGTGGCKDAVVGLNGVVEKTSLVRGSNVQVTFSSSPNAHRIAMSLAQVITTNTLPLKNPLTCSVLIFSKMSNGRRISSIQYTTTVESAQLFEMKDEQNVVGKDSDMPSTANAINGPTLCIYMITIVTFLVHILV